MQRAQVDAVRVVASNLKHSEDVVSAVGRAGGVGDHAAGLGLAGFCHVRAEQFVAWLGRGFAFHMRQIHA
ncbi:MAG: hypothetical protein Q8K54_03260, partial [Gallionella sp.]|nr:hypothetical protein [Gallionella sp.]